MNTLNVPGVHRACHTASELKSVLWAKSFAFNGLLSSLVGKIFLALYIFPYQSINHPIEYSLSFPSTVNPFSLSRGLPGLTSHYSYYLCVSWSLSLNGDFLIGEDP